MFLGKTLNPNIYILAKCGAQGSAEKKGLGPIALKNIFVPKQVDF